ncbi:DUF6678 family protein [Aquimarina sediminis]|uniref:DUF6678 family protein n=1 Tax=Aquimarina sediminis TaxID=2070536 RepID=UPI000CA048A9|nr:DUF6678 family protein [Aquimarina sediminis]
MSKVEKHQRQLRQEIDNRASFMNATKWKALFSVLKNVNPSYLLKIKLLLEDEIREVTIPNSEDFISEKYLEEYWGVFELKEIEWILIPSKITLERKNREELLVPKVTHQNIEVIEKELQSGKQFEYENSDLGLKIYGYR